MSSPRIVLELDVVQGRRLLEALEETTSDDGAVELRELVLAKLRAQCRHRFTPPSSCTAGCGVLEELERTRAAIIAWRNAKAGDQDDARNFAVTLTKVDELELWLLRALGRLERLEGLER
jgi:hypothetical protein